WNVLFLSPLQAHIHCEDVFGILGENFTFPVKIDQKIEEIFWTKNKDRVAAWEGQNKPTYFTSLKNRGLLNKENGCLTIFNLEKNDAGIYVLEYLDSGKESYDLKFTLAVLARPLEPEISCNVSGDDLVLKCTADFEKPLNYTWKFSSLRITYQTQEVFIPKKNIDASEKAACSIKFSQMEKSSAISLTECFPDKKGGSLHKRSRGGLVAAFVLLIPVVGILGFLYRRELSAMQNSTLTSKCVADHGVSEEDTFKKENSSLLAKHAGDHGVSGEEVTQDAESGTGEHLSNSPSCSKEENRVRIIRRKGACV
ncbi:PREDICTED: lymphocyte function-associated antigen 3-like, partial [Leptosomus discolor]|uniref:lymphocyte function-associated antigen 3-like n=1 Tax=Leptosomus discolor TaxID=188344 RepID=UPI000522E07C